MRVWAYTDTGRICYTFNTLKGLFMAEDAANQWAVLDLQGFFVYIIK